MSKKVQFFSEWKKFKSLYLILKMKSNFLPVLFLCLTACNDTLLEKPDNLIPEDKMVEVLKDLAIVNAAKSTNISVLRDNDIQPMDYIYQRHDIDSVQFVESDRYYASLPVTYERIYKKVESKLEQEVQDVEEAKKLNDSLRRVEMENGESKTYLEKSKDSLY